MRKSVFPLHEKATRGLLIFSTLVLGACGQMTWKEEVQLQNGDLIVVKRTAKAKAFGEIAGPGGWENEGMSIEVVQPVNPNIPPPWNGKFVPLLFDRDAETSEWFMVATFYSCQSWYDLGRPKLPYTEVRLKKGFGCSGASPRRSLGAKAMC